MKLHRHDLATVFVKRFKKVTSIEIHQFVMTNQAHRELAFMVTCSLVDKSQHPTRPVDIYRPTEAGLMVLSAWMQMERLSEEIDPNGE